METEKLSFDAMEALTGEGSWKDCASFALSAISCFTGPEGILGLGGMALSAGGCEAYMYG